MGMVIRVLTICKYVTRCMGASVDFQITIECRGAVDRGNSREVEVFPFERDISGNLHHDTLNTSSDRQRMGRAVITELRAISVFRTPDVFISERRVMDV